MSESQSNLKVSQSLEPKAGRMPVPLWAVTLVGLFTFVGIARLVNSGGAFDPNIYARYSDFKEVDDQHPKAPEPSWRPIGRKVYGANCAACHQANGKGAGPIKPLDGSPVVLDADKNKQIHAVLNGQNNGAMPAWKQLSDTDIAAVISYTKNNWSNKTGQLVQPADVLAQRGK